MKNQEFNRYVENNLMHRLFVLARFDGQELSDSDPLNASKTSIQNTAEELMARG